MAVLLLLCRPEEVAKVVLVDGMVTKLQAALALTVDLCPCPGIVVSLQTKGGVWKGWWINKPKMVGLFSSFSWFA